MRFVLCLLVASMCGAVSAQTQGDIMAWQSCQQARQACKLTSVFTPRAADQAIQAVAKARIAFDGVPAKYKGQFQATMDSINAGLASASKTHGTADGLEAGADGAYAVIAARIARGEWFGVEKVANDCADLYRKAYANHSAAQQGYGGVTGAANNLVLDIQRFLSMLDAYEGFYGPLP